MKICTGYVLIDLKDYSDISCSLINQLSSMKNEIVADEIHKKVSESFIVEGKYVRINDKPQVRISFNDFIKFLNIYRTFNLKIDKLLESVIVEVVDEIQLNSAESIKIGVSTGIDRSTVNLKEKNGKIVIESGYTILTGKNTSNLRESFLPNITDYSGNVFYEEEEVNGLEESSNKALIKYEMLIGTFIKSLMTKEETVVDTYKLIEGNRKRKGNEETEEFLDALVSAYFHLIEEGFSYDDKIIYYPETKYQPIVDRIASLQLHR